MSIGEKLVKQHIEDTVAGQDVNLDITCYEEDGTTLRDMTSGAWKLTFEATSFGHTVTKTSDAGEIEFGVPDTNSIRVKLLSSDLAQLSTHTRWKLYGTDATGSNAFVAAIGTWRVIQWG